MMGQVHPTIRRLSALVPALVLSAAVTATAASTGFLEPASLLVTVGGALVVTALTFPLDSLRIAFRVASEALGDATSQEAVIGFLKQAARVHRVDGARALEDFAREAPDDFLRDAIDRSLTCDDDDEVREALAGEMRRRHGEGETARQVVLTLGKLFPAFGLIGTLLGLVLLLRHLAAGDLDGVAPGLGLSVMTTLYGAFLANVVALPLATKLTAHLARRQNVMLLTVEGVLLVRRMEFPTRVERLLRARASGTSPGPVAEPTRLRLVAESAA